VKSVVIGLALAFGALCIGSPAQPNQGRAAQPVAKTSRSFELGAGRARRAFYLRQPKGVVLLTRLTVTHGIGAYLTATIPSGAGVRVSSIAERGDPLSPCRRRGRFDVCTQAQEWCPMPTAKWRILLVKVGGPAGLVRFDFAVGKPPR
jgi:hypothetical protein